MTKFGIGQSVARIEDERLLAGCGSFVDDLRFDGEAHLVFVRAQHARGRIVALDLDAARAAADVLAVYTAADLRGQVEPFQPSSAGIAPPFPVLADAEVRFVGQPVVAIVAATRAAAERAAATVWVEIEAQPAVATLEAALAPDAPLLWPGAPGNVAARSQLGDAAACAAAFATAAHVSRVAVRHQRLSPVTLEPRGGAAVWDAGTGRLTYHASSQAPATFRRTLAAALHLPADRVRVRVGDVGGGFGLKALLHPEDVMACFAARALARPVRWRATRLEEFQAAAQGRDQLADGELALAADGRILGMRVRIRGGIGAYAHGAGLPIHLYLAAKVITSVYRVPALDYTAEAVLQNACPIGAYRGAGRPEAIYLAERLMDRAAAELGLDPAELRRRNLVLPAEMPYRTAGGETYDSGDFPRLLAAALRAADWDGFAARREQSRARGRLRGRAVSTFLEWTGVVHTETVHLSLTAAADGPRVRVATAMQAMGQGIETSYVQILSEALQLDAARIEIVQGDSDAAQGIGSMGSRSLYIGGSAMLSVAQETVERGRALAAAALEAPAADLEYRDGRYTIAGTDRGIDLGTLAAAQPEARIAVDTTQKVGGASWPNGCHVCELEVDPDTGAVQIVRYTTVDDVGRVINPMIVAGQVHGGLAQAVGQALGEAVVYDEGSGQLLTGSFMDYALPRADELPRIDTYTDESQPCRINPLGAKGVGELGTVGGTPTVINALLDALRPLGVTDIEMPASPWRVWQAIRSAPRRSQ